MRKQQTTQSLTPHGETLNTLAIWYYTYSEAKNLQPQTLYFYRQKLRYLTDKYGERQPEEITVQELRQLVVDLQKSRKWSVQQTNHFITVCKQFFNYLVDEELTEANPTHRLDKLKQETRYPKVLTMDDITRLLRSSPDTFTGQRNRLMMLTLLDTGVRMNELLSLTMGDLDLPLMQLRVFGKGRKERFVPFSPSLARHIVKYLPRRSQYAACAALWVNLQGMPITAHYFAHTLREYSQLAGITPSAHAHLFRHTFATEYLRNGGSPQMLQRILGHTTQTMTQRYVHITDTDAATNHRIASPLEKWKALQAVQKQRRR